MFEFRVKAGSYEELRQKMAAFLGTEPVATINTPNVQLPPEPKAAKPKKERAKPAAKEAALAAAATPVFTPEQAQEAIASLNVDKTYTRDEVVLALKDLTKEKPIEVARAILNQFGCARVSELKDEHFTMFVNACELAKKATI